jgi:hypothetical protein
MNFYYRVFLQERLDLQNRRPKDRSGPCISSSPKRGVGIIFSLHNIGEKRVFSVTKLQAVWIRRLLLISSVSLMPRPP